MKRTLVLCLIILNICLMLPSLSTAQKWPGAIKPGKGDVRVSYVEGTVKALPKGSLDWRSMKMSDAVQGGDEIRIAGKSRLEIVMPDKSTFRFADDTHFKILQAPDTAAQNVKVHVTVGRVWANVTWLSA